MIRNGFNKANNTGAFNELKQEMHVYFNAGYVFPISDNLHVKPSVLVRAINGSPISYDLNTNFWIADVLGVGVSYRNKTAMVGLIDVKLIPELYLGYSYDHATSGLAGYGGATHEVSISWNFMNQKERRLNFCYF